VIDLGLRQRIPVGPMVEKVSMGRFCKLEFPKSVVTGLN
jgi:hypothetical protein